MVRGVVHRSAHPRARELRVKMPHRKAESRDRPKHSFAVHDWRDLNRPNSHGRDAEATLFSMLDEEIIRNPRRGSINIASRRIVYAKALRFAAVLVRTTNLVRRPGRAGCAHVQESRQ